MSQRIWETHVVPPSSWFSDIDWPRIGRWALLGFVVMLLWLMVPVAKCSWHAFKDEPLGEVDAETANPGQADNQRVEEGAGFFARWGHAIKGCYKLTPLFGQEQWKGYLLVGFGSAAALCWILGRLGRRRKPFVEK